MKLVPTREGREIYTLVSLKLTVVVDPSSSWETRNEREREREEGSNFESNQRERDLQWVEAHLGVSYESNYYSYTHETPSFRGSSSRRNGCGKNENKKTKKRRRRRRRRRRRKEPGRRVSSAAVWQTIVKIERSLREL